jgi:hypothetical protein
MEGSAMRAMISVHCRDDTAVKSEQTHVHPSSSLMSSFTSYRLEVGDDVTLFVTRRFLDRLIKEAVALHALASHAEGIEDESAA